MLNTVKVPRHFEPLFQKAQDYVNQFFSEKRENPGNGTIDIFGERYILVRAASMSVDFFETLEGLYEREGKEEANNIARQILFDIAHAIGKQDARNFHKKMNLQDPIEKLSAGPVYFAHTGWAFVDISDESSPTPNEDYYLIYDHPYSFESSAWLASGKKSEFPVCVMNAGYSSGWCEESFGVGLVATEIMCRAKGDRVCRFIMAPPARMQEHIAAYMKKQPELAKSITQFEVPGFFKRKQAELALRGSEERFRTLFDNATEGIVLVDIEDRHFLQGNASICRMLGYSEEEIGHLQVEDIHPKETLPSILSEFNRHASGDMAAAQNIPVMRKDGSVFYAEITAARINIGNKIYLAGFFRDISERKKAEEAIRELNDGLEAKVQERTQRLLDVQAELVRSEKLALLGRVADTVGHELRNPLGVMNNAVYFLQNVLHDPDEITREYLGIIKEGISDAERIVSDLLDAVRTKPPHTELVDLAELLLQTLRKCEIPPSVHVQMDISQMLPAIRVDPMQIHQVFWNLITNGIEAMPDGGELKIKAVENHAAKTVNIHIEDGGIGITPEQQRLLFQPLFTTKARRVGLGLVVVKNLTQINGGSTAVESVPGKGSVFTVSLPCA